MQNNKIYWEYARLQWTPMLVPLPTNVRPFQGGVVLNKRPPTSYRLTECPLQPAHTVTNISLFKTGFLIHVTAVVHVDHINPPLPCFLQLEVYFLKQTIFFLFEQLVYNITIHLFNKLYTQLLLHCDHIMQSGIKISTLLRE